MDFDFRFFVFALTSNFFVKIIQLITKYEVKVPIVGVVNKTQQINLIDENYFKIKRGAEENNPCN